MNTLILAIKLAASPTLIGFASLAGKRFGPTIAGLLGGLPLIAGPVLLAVWLVSGPDYAQKVAASASAGVWANIAFMLAAGFASARYGWRGMLLAAWAAYLLVAALLAFSGLALQSWCGWLVLVGLWWGARHGMPKPTAPPKMPALPTSEVLARMACACLLVAGLATASGLLGSTVTGIFSAAPVSATVIPAFTLATAGRDATLLVLRGFLIGLMGFVAFSQTMAGLIPLLGTWAWLPALLVGPAVGFLALHLYRRLA